MARAEPGERFSVIVSLRDSAPRKPTDRLAREFGFRPSRR